LSVNVDGSAHFGDRFFITAKKSEVFRKNFIAHGDILPICSIV
jgi:hypothetical protein